MRIFFSHASRDKPLVREVRADMPDHVRSWIDERELLVGENLTDTLRAAIQSETDFLILFVGAEAVRSDWVQRELGWALEKEKDMGRVFILPVVLDLNAWQNLPEEITDRRYLLCTDFTRVGVRQFANRLSDELFAWLSRLAERKPAIPRSTENDLLQAAQNRARSLAAILQEQTHADAPISSKARDLLNALINTLAPLQRLELLFIYEVMKGRFTKELDADELNRGRGVQVVFDAPDFGRLTHVLQMDWRRLS